MWMPGPFGSRSGILHRSPRPRSHLPASWNVARRRDSSKRRDHTGRLQHEHERDERQNDGHELLVATVHGALENAGGAHFFGSRSHLTSCSFAAPFITGESRHS